MLHLGPSCNTEADQGILGGGTHANFGTTPQIVESTSELMEGEEEHVTPIDISVRAEFLNNTKNRTSDHVQNKPQSGVDMYMNIECPSIKQ